MTHFYVGELSSFIRQLGSAWSAVLYYSDKALGIDSKFTRPAVKAMLRELGHKFVATGYEGLRPFEWDAYKAKNAQRAEAKKRKAEYEVW